MRCGNLVLLCCSYGPHRAFVVLSAGTQSTAGATLKRVGVSALSYAELLVPVLGSG